MVHDDDAFAFVRYDGTWRPPFPELTLPTMPHVLPPDAAGKKKVVSLLCMADILRSMMMFVVCCLRFAVCCSNRAMSNDRTIKGIKEMSTEIWLLLY